MSTLLSYWKIGRTSFLARRFRHFPISVPQLTIGPSARLHVATRPQKEHLRYRAQIIRCYNCQERGIGCTLITFPKPCRRQLISAISADFRRGYSKSSHEARKWPLYLDKLCFVGFLCLAYWIVKRAYRIWIGTTMLYMWPEDIRFDVIDCMDALVQKDFLSSEESLRRAIFRLRHMPIEELGEEPHLKLTSLLIFYGNVLETDNKLASAYNAYLEAWLYLKNLKEKVPLTEYELFRAIAVATKLGILAFHLHYPVEKEQQWFEWAVHEYRKWKEERVAKSGDCDKYEDLAANFPYDVTSIVAVGAPKDYWGVTINRLLAFFPGASWATNPDPGDAFRSLGNIYGRQKNYEQAIIYYCESLNEPVTLDTKDDNYAVLASATADLLEKYLSSPRSKKHVLRVCNWLVQMMNVHLVVDDQIPSPTNLPDLQCRWKHHVKLLRTFAVISKLLLAAGDFGRVGETLTIIQRLMELNQRILEEIELIITAKSSRAQAAGEKSESKTES